MLSAAAIHWCAASTLAQSSNPGMGATLYDTGSAHGVTFRTWAPNATTVHVAGTFNGWNGSSFPLTSEGNGYWSRDIPNLTAGHQYQFVIRRPANEYWKIDSNATRVTNSVGNAIIYDQDAYQWQVNDFQIPSWNELVIYEMHIGTFNVPSGTTVPGSFAEAIDRLDELEDLGINAIELMPTAEFPGDISWGYNGSHPYAVEAGYGGPDGLKALIDAAHARGIAVLTDLVYSHLGPTDLDLWQYDGWASPTTSGGIFFYPDYRANTPWGNTRPDYTRGEVRQYLRDNVLYWLREFRFDGVRFDGTKYIRRTDIFGEDLPEGWSLMQWINDSVNAEFPGKIMIAEDFDSNHWITKTTGEGGAGFDSQWDSNFFWPIRTAIIPQNDADRNMYSVRDAIWYAYNGSALQRVIYTESHDEVANGQARVPEMIWPGNAGSWYSRKRSTLGAALVFTSPGIPMLFMGQEFLEDSYFQDSVPLDWSRADTYAGIREMYKDMIALRTDSFSCTRGLTGPSTNVHHVNNGAKVIGYHRWQSGGAGDDVVVIANFSNTSFADYRLGFPRSGQWKLRLNSDSTEYSADFGNMAAGDVWTDAWSYDGMAQSASVKLAPYSFLIYSQGDCTYPPQYDPADLNQDGAINGLDLAVLLGGWGGSAAGDVNGSGLVDGADLTLLLSAWGT